MCIQQLLLMKKVGVSTTLIYWLLLDDGKGLLHCVHFFKFKLEICYVKRKTQAQPSGLCIWQLPLGIVCFRTYFSKNLLLNLGKLIIWSRTTHRRFVFNMIVSWCSSLAFSALPSQNSLGSCHPSKKKNLKGQLR